MPDRRTTVRGRGPRRGRRLTLLALTALTAGIAVVVIAVLTQQHAATPSPSAWGRLPSASGSSAVSPSLQPSGPDTAAAPTDHAPEPTRSSARAGRPAARPVKIKIPAIKVNAAVFAIGKDAQGGLQVPQPGKNLNNVGWYKYSPTPGQTGPSVLEGHVDTIHGPSVFLRLGDLIPGDVIKIARTDGSVADFTVDGVRAYQSHDDFPTDLVYSGDLSRPTLRIITCSNFDHSTGHYVGNTIVFAHLTRMAG